MAENGLNGECEEHNSLLQAELDKYKKNFEALQQEFNTGDEASPESIKKAFVAAAPAAIQEIITLSTNADSESVRGTMSKYIVDYAAGKMDGSGNDDSITKLMRELMGNDEPTKTKAKTK